MAKRRSIIFFALLKVSLFCCAAEQAPPPMEFVAIWDGPFADTRVVKVADPSEGVACYMMIPKSVPSERVCQGGGMLGEQCQNQYRASIGSISCVKVTDARPPTFDPSKKR